MESETFLSIVTCALLLSACSEWPPAHEDLTERFNDDPEAFEQLADKILDTDYVQVSGGCVVNSDREKVSLRVTLTTLVDESTDKGYRYEQEYVDDDEWTDLFCRTLVWSAKQRDGVVRFDFGSSLSRNSRHVFAQYIHSRAMLQTRKPCLPEFKKIPCGLCSVELENDWYIEYWWSPEELVPGGFDRVLDQEITEDKYYELFHRNLEQCRADGLSQIGYNLDEFPDADS